MRSARKRTGAWQWLKMQLETVFWPFAHVRLRAVTQKERVEAVASVRQDHLLKLDDKSIPLARLLMDENRRICEFKIASIRGLDTKAIGQVAAAGTILALLSAFGSNLAFWARAIPIFFLIVAIAMYVVAAYVRTGALPSFGHYLSTGIIAEPKNEARVAMLAAGAWRDYSRDLEVVNETKAKYVKIGNVWLVGALLAILVAVLLPSGSNAQAQSTAHASGHIRRSCSNVPRRQNTARRGREPRHRLYAA